MARQLTHYMGFAYNEAYSSMARQLTGQYKDSHYMGFAFNEAYSSMVRQWTGQYKGFPSTKLIYKTISKGLNMWWQKT